MNAPNQPWTNQEAETYAAAWQERLNQAATEDAKKQAQAQYDAWKAMADKAREESYRAEGQALARAKQAALELMREQVYGGTKAAAAIEQVRGKEREKIDRLAELRERSRKDNRSGPVHQAIAGKPVEQEQDAAGTERWRLAQLARQQKQGELEARKQEEKNRLDRTHAAKAMAAQSKSQAAAQPRACWFVNPPMDGGLVRFLRRRSRFFSLYGRRELLACITKAARMFYRTPLLVRAVA